MVMARDCAILRHKHARFHIGCFRIRETGVIAYGQGALGTQRGLYAVDDEQRVMLLGQQSGRVVELALQRFSGLSLSHHRLHVQGLDVQVVFFSSGKSGFQRINVVWNDSDGKMAVSMLETGQVLLVCFPAAVAESSGAVSEIVFHGLVHMRLRGAAARHDESRGSERTSCHRNCLRAQ